MTWTTRILAILNILAAGALFWYAGQSAYMRSDYAHKLQQLRETRDGISTGDWFARLKQADRERLVDTIVITDELLARLPEADARALREFQDRKAGELQRLGRPRAESDMARRDAMGRLPYSPVDRLGEIVAGPAMIPFEVDTDALYKKNDKGENIGVFQWRLRDGKPREPAKIGDPVRLTLINKPAETKDIEEMARLLGMDGFKRLYRESALLQQARLPAEEAELAERKAALLSLQARYQRDLLRNREETDNLKARVEAEMGLRVAILRENDERRAELARIYAEMAEAFAARESALGRLRDAERQLQDAREDIRQLTQENQRFLEEIAGLESNTRK